MCWSSACGECWGWEHTELLDSTNAGNITELLVHVVGSSPAVVSKEDAEVACAQLDLFGDGVDHDDLVGRREK
jgi:hypothetical protein